MTDTQQRQQAPEWDPSKPLGVASSQGSGGGSRDYTNPEPGSYVAELMTVREVPREKWPHKKNDKGELLYHPDGSAVLTPKVRLIWRMLKDEDGEPCPDDMTLGQTLTLSLFRTAHLNKVAAAIYRIDYIPDGYAITPADLIGYQAWVDVVSWKSEDGARSGVMVKRDPLGVRPLTGKRAANTPAPTLDGKEEDLAF